MTPELVVRYIVWTSALAGVLVAFAWPFAISADPDSAALMILSRGIVLVLLLALAVAAVTRARRTRKDR